MTTVLKSSFSSKKRQLLSVAAVALIALSGGTQAPGIGEIVVTLGMEETVRRIRKAREFVAGK